MFKKKYRTDFLFPRTGFWIGAGTVFNVAGSYYDFNYSSSAEEADSKAIESDWGMIGSDIEKVVKENAADMLLHKKAS